MTSPIDFLGIEAFIAIVESGGFQQAASQLHLSQTAVSHRMRKLEESLGVRLIVRTTRDIALTEAGRALLPKARSAVRELASSCESVRNHGHNANEWLSLACLPTVATGIVGPLLTACRERWPDRPVRVFDSSVHEIAELVESRVAAFGISVARASHPALLVERVADEPFVLVCPASHPLAARDVVTWGELGGEPMVRIALPSGNSMTIDDALGARRSDLRWRYEAQHNAAALDLVRAGLGLTVVPALSVHASPQWRVLALQAPAVTRSLCVLSRRDEALDETQAWLRGATVSLIRERIGGV